MRTACILLLVLAAACPAWAVTVTTADKGEIQFLDDTQVFTTIMGGSFGPAWEGITQADAYNVTDSLLSATRRELSGTFDISGTAATCTFDEAVWRDSAPALGGQYDFTVNQTAQFNSLFVSFYLPCDRYGGTTFTAYDSGGAVLQTLVMPVTHGETWLFSRSGVARIEIALGSEIGYTISFSSTAQAMLQDNREWGGRDFELRVDLLGSYSGSPVPAGTQFSRPFAVTFGSDAEFQLDPTTAISRTDTSGWVAYTLPWNAAPVDLSWLNDKPAGAHGFLRVRDGKLVFDDGTPARFWGVCASAAANFPTHEQSDLIAARMAKFGVNIVRTHHADAVWSSPNFFDESYGDTQHFDADALDRFDYFVYALKSNGVYVYLDQLVHRGFTEGDGVASAAQLDPAAKPYTIFDPTLIALQKQFSHDLWTHVNPYTGIAYGDDPAIAMMDFTNENDLMVYDVTVEPYASDLEAMWGDWAAAHAVDPGQPIRYVAQRSSDVLRFLDEVQQSYYSEMYQYLREVGVTVPITGNTWLVLGANLPSQAAMDYMDAHAYWDHPTGNYDHFHNRAQVKANPAAEGNNFSGLSISRVQGLPLAISEWGHPWPNEWRSEGSLATAAVGSLQGWDALLAYTYRHSSDVPVDKLSGPFDTFNDPAVFGLFPAASIMFRRGDVAQSGPPTAVHWTEADIFGTPQTWLWGGLPAYRSLVESTAIVTTITTPTGVKAVVSPGDYVPTAGATYTQSDTGELRRDWSLGLGTIDTPRSQAAYGYLGDAGQIDLTDISIAVTNPFAVVALTSLDGREIRTSRHLLLTAVGRAENTSMVYNLTHTQLVESGTGPVLVDPITGQVIIRTSYDNSVVTAVSPTGSRTDLFSVAADGGAITLDLGAYAGTIYYEIATTQTFTDVSLIHWAFDEIEACHAAGIVSGFPDHTYRPRLPVTRDQMAVFVSRALADGDANVPTGPAEPTFPDVPADHWAFRYVEYAVANNVVEGYPEGNYRPDLTVDRGQMAVFIARSIATPTGEEGLVGYDPPAEPTFPDVPAGYWAYKHIEYIADPARAITEGYPGGMYHPEYVCTRDQMAVYVVRAFQLLD